MQREPEGCWRVLALAAFEAEDAAQNYLRRLGEALLKAGFRAADLASPAQGPSYLAPGGSFRAVALSLERTEPEVRDFVELCLGAWMKPDGWLREPREEPNEVETPVMSPYDELALPDPGTMFEFDEPPEADVASAPAPDPSSLPEDARRRLEPILASLREHSRAASSLSERVETLMRVAYARGQRDTLIHARRFAAGEKSAFGHVFADLGQVEFEGDIAFALGGDSAKN